MTERRASFLRDLFRQLASSAPRIDVGRWCAHNAFLGTILLGGALVLRFSAPPDVLGARGFAFVVASAGALLAAAVLPLVRPTLVPALLAADGLLVIALTVAFSITTAMTYGSALWADFGPDRAHARPWRRAGFILGIALEAVVGALVIAAAMRA